MRKVRALFLGCGFLGSNLVPQVLPHLSSLVLVDRDEVELGNYDNHLIPKGYEGRKKVMALASLVSLLSEVPVFPVHMNVQKMEQLMDLQSKFNPDIVICSFDNVESRALVKEYSSRSGIPTLFLGVTENYIYIDWGENLVLPRGDISSVLRGVRDVCSRLDFRALGSLASALAYYSFREWLMNDSEISFIAHISEDGIRISRLVR